MIKIYTGPMYSGKTTELINNYNRFNKYNQLIIDYNTDNKNNNNDIENNCIIYDNLYDHNKNKIMCIKLNSLTYLKNLYINKSNIFYDVKYIHINEAQFFDDLKEIVLFFVEYAEINTYVYGLDSDWARNKFGQIHELIPYADSLIKLKGICKYCDNESLFSHRICYGTEQIIINDDNENKYISLCRKCYIKIHSFPNIY